MQRVDNTREDARILYHQGYYEEAILLLQDWLTQYPDDASGWEILAAAGVRRRGARIVSCPTCARCRIDLIGLAEKVAARLENYPHPITVAVMGCVVNGPGEAREADLGIAAGNKRGHLFVKGRNVAVVPEDEMVETLVEWAEFIHAYGTDAAIARADTTIAEREAEKDRLRALDDRGADANHAQEKIVEIRRTVSGS